MKQDFNLPSAWQFAEKAELTFPQEVIDENLFLRVYQQMLASGQTRTCDHIAPYYSSNDPWKALMFMQRWFNTVYQDRVTDYRYGRCYNSIIPSALPHPLRWQKFTNLQNLRAASNINLAFMRDTFENQIKRHPLAFPAPMATQTLFNAVKTAQAIRPYLDGSKTLEHPEHDEHMREMFRDIVNMIHFIGACTGLSKQMVEDLKSEIIAPTMEGQGFDLKLDTVVVLESTPRPATPKKQPLMEIRWRR